MSARPEVHGTCDPEFAPVREAFAANFERGAETVVEAPEAVLQQG